VSTSLRCEYLLASTITTAGALAEEGDKCGAPRLPYLLR